MSMSTQNRHSSFSSSMASSLAKRHAPSSENLGKPGNLPKKRVPLGNLTNQRNDVGSEGSTRGPLAHSTELKVTKMAKARKVSSTSNSTSAISSNGLPLISSVKSSAVVPSKNPPARGTEETACIPDSAAVTALPVRCSIAVSPSRSDDRSLSVDEMMSTCESFKSPDVEYIDSNEVSALDSIDRKTFSNLYIMDNAAKKVNICTRDALGNEELDGEKANIDNNYMDPQLCATIACDIYKHLRASEVKKRPSTDFMERIQKDISAGMRAILVDWLVEVAEEYRLMPDTLYLTVNYIDRYLSGNVMNRQRLQLLGVASMMIASKYEEICAPQVEEFCYITDNTYLKDEVLQMESAVLNYLKFELTAPTAKCFLRRFVRAAQAANEVPSMQLECLASYIAEISLLECTMLCHAPSIIAASSIFLAKYILLPSKRPWSSTLQHYTMYQPSDLRECVEDLHRLCLNSHSSNLPAIREKYSQHKYKCVAKKHCPPSIPAEFFHNCFC